MQLYPVYLDDHSNHHSYDDRAFNNNECKGVYLSMEDALERVIEEQSRYPGRWRQVGNYGWGNGSLFCCVNTITVQDITDSEIWMVFHGSSYRAMKYFATEAEARNYIHNDMKDPAEWTEVNHNQWASDEFFCYIRRFNILYEMPVKGAIDDY